MGVTLRYPYEVRDEKDYFDDIEDEKVTKDMLDLAVAHRGYQARGLRAGEVRGSIRGCAEGTAEEEAKGRKDRAAARTRGQQCRQHHGCAAPQRERGVRRASSAPAPGLAAQKGPETANNGASPESKLRARACPVNFSKGMERRGWTHVVPAAAHPPTPRMARSIEDDALSRRPHFFVRHVR